MGAADREELRGLSALVTSMNIALDAPKVRLVLVNYSAFLAKSHFDVSNSP